MFYQSCFQNRLALTTLTKKTSVSGKLALREQNVLMKKTTLTVMYMHAYLTWIIICQRSTCERVHSTSSNSLLSCVWRSVATSTWNAWKIKKRNPVALKFFTDSEVSRKEEPHKKITNYKFKQIFVNSVLEELGVVLFLWVETSGNVFSRSIWP